MTDSTNPVTYALAPGETTSEHAVMKEAVSHGNWLIAIGSFITVASPWVQQLVDFIHSNQSWLDNKYVAYVMAALGVITTVMGAASTLLARLGYMQGRAQIKAATVIDANTVKDLVK